MGYTLLIIDCSRLCCSTENRNQTWIQSFTIVNDHQKSLSWETLLFCLWLKKTHRDTRNKNFSFFCKRGWIESLWPLPPPPPLSLLLLLLSLQPPTKWNSKLFFNKFFLFRWPHRLFSHNAIKNAIISKLNNQSIMIYWVLLYFRFALLGTIISLAIFFVWVQGPLHLKLFYYVLKRQTSSRLKDFTRWTQRSNWI